MRHRFSVTFSIARFNIVRFSVFVLGIVVMSFFANPAGAQTLDEIASTVDRTGRYLELDLEPVADEAVGRANNDSIGFIYLDQENAADLPIIATGILERLSASGSEYRALIVLDSSGVWVESLDADAARAADAATAAFARGAVASGVDTVVEVLGGGSEASTAGNDNDSADPQGGESASSPSPASDGGGVPWLLIILLGVAAFFIVRWFTSRKRKAAALEAALAEDRAEIREQLRNNADHVIDLGDRIAHADDDLRTMYEEAAQAYQDVSLGLDEASTSAEIDALDDRIDRAEWQFEVIEARLDGRTPPPEPRSDENASPPPPGRPRERREVPPLGGDAPRRPTGRSGRPLDDDRPAFDDDTSLFPGGRGRRPTSRRQPRRGGGVFSGLAKAGLLSLVMKLLLGGGLGIGNTSRRTQQRQSQSRGGAGRGGSGLGGGVLR